MAETWVTVEETLEVKEQLVEDMVNEIMAEKEPQEADEQHEISDDDSDSSNVVMEDIDRQPTMTFHEVDEQLLRIGEYAKSTGCAKLQTAHTQFWRLVQQDRTKSRGATNNKQASLFKFFTPGDATGSNSK
jgi:hypothetical protein